jgi:hypothetical protein
MNITTEILDFLNDEYATIVIDNKEIQFYYNQTNERYQFKDSRFSNTSSVWDNGDYRTIERLIEAFKKHISAKQFISKHFNKTIDLLNF